MKKNIILLALLTLSACSSYGPVTRSVDEDLQSGYSSGYLSERVRLSFGGNQEIKGVNLGPADVKKNNRYDRKDPDWEVNEACRKSFVEAAAALQQKALNIGGNAVVRICSRLKHDTFCDSALYYCQGGKTKSAVTLHGTIVKE